MALRKKYDFQLNRNIQVEIDPFINKEIDNGLIKLEGNFGTIILTFDELTKLYGKVFPQQSYDCNGNKKDNWATLTEKEREEFYAVFPEARPKEEKAEGFYEMAFDKREAY